MMNYFTINEIAEQHQFNRATLLQFLETFSEELKPYIRIQSGQKRVHNDGIALLKKIQELYQVHPSLEEIKKGIGTFMETLPEVPPVSEKKQHKKKKKKEESPLSIQTAVDKVLLDFQKKYIARLESDVSYFKKSYEELRCSSYEERKRSDYILAQMQQTQKLLKSDYEKRVTPSSYKRWSNKWLISQLAAMFSLVVIPR